MMLDASDPLVQFKITSVTCSFIALGATIYRLYKRRGRFGADDASALIASMALVIQVVGVFLHGPGSNHLSKTTRVAAFYLTGTTFYIVVWASRLSILFSIIRIDPCTKRRKRLIWVSAAFGAALLFLLSQLFWVCEEHSSWKDSRTPQCELPLQVAICQIVTDVSADMILLFAPLPLFRNLLNKSLGHKLTLIFSTCVATTIVSIVHAAFILRGDHVKVTISTLVEDCLGLFVANIPVMITTTIDIVGDADRSQTRRTARFTTIFWPGESQTTTEETELYTIREEGPDGPISCAKATDDPPPCATAEKALSTQRVLVSIPPIPSTHA
ncbi:hypothetical protein B0H19DRAFT_1038928 [Mycena capillaripes]|nr:hypothetical protein B0H19DRAFT_1038928 [Mycena capillaripes]